MRGTPHSLWLSMANRWAATGTAYWNAVAGEALRRGSRDRRRQSALRAARPGAHQGTHQGAHPPLAAAGKGRTGKR